MIWMPKVLHIDTPDDPVVCFQQFFHARVVASLQDSIRVWCPGNHFSPGQPGWLTIVPRTHQTSWYHPEVMVNAYNLLSAVDSFVLKNLVPQMAISGMLTNILCRGSKICHENWECFCGNCGLTPTWIRRKEVEVEPSSKVWWTPIVVPQRGFGLGEIWLGVQCVFLVPGWAFPHLRKFTVVLSQYYMETGDLYGYVNPIPFWWLDFHKIPSISS